MANSRFSQFVYHKHTMVCMIDLQILIGSTGAVTSFVGKGVSTVTRGGVGAYQIKLQDNYFGLYDYAWDLVAPTAGAGSTVNDGSFVTGTTYFITTLGTTTTWSDVPAGITAAVGVPFIASGAGGAGNGVAKAIGVPAVTSVAIAGKGMLAPVAPYKGSVIIAQCFGPTSSSVTTLIPAEITSGSYFNLKFLLQNSSLA